MIIALHKNATTTPEVRRAIQACDKSMTDREVAKKFGVSDKTAAKWRRREFVEDLSHATHTNQSIFSDLEEEIIVALRKDYLVPLPDLLSAVKNCLKPDATRSALVRCINRNDVGSLRELKPKKEKAPHSPFKEYVPGYFHIDVKYLPRVPGQKTRSYLFVAIDRATRWAYLKVYKEKTAENARDFLENLDNTSDIRIKIILTDNGREFTDRAFGKNARGPSGNHEFDKLCDALGIEHRLTPPGRPQTNGMVERFNGRITAVIDEHQFISQDHLEETFGQYAYLYNEHLPQSVLNDGTPRKAITDWHTKRPELFKNKPDNHPKPDR